MLSRRRRISKIRPHRRVGFACVTGIDISISFFEQTEMTIGDQQAGRNWESITLNNPFLCGRMLQHIILTQPYPQIVRSGTPSHNSTKASPHCFTHEQWLWVVDGVSGNSIWGVGLS